MTQIVTTETTSPREQPFAAAKEESAEIPRVRLNATVLLSIRWLSPLMFSQRSGTRIMSMSTRQRPN